MIIFHLPDTILWHYTEYMSNENRENILPFGSRERGQIKKKKSEQNILNKCKEKNKADKGHSFWMGECSIFRVNRRSLSKMVTFE